MKALTRQEWESLWREPTDSAGWNLHQAAEHDKQRRAKLNAKYPGMKTSNKRYVCHLEDVLSRGGSVGDEHVASVTFEEISRDFYAFPKLVARAFPERLAEVKRLREAMGLR